MPGVSKHLLVLTLTILFTLGTSSVSGAAAPGDWPEFHQGPSHMGLNQSETTLTRSNVSTLQTLWTFPSSVTDAVVSGGTVYTVSGFTLYALDAGTGASLWSFTPPGDLAEVSMPAISKGRIYLVANLFNPPFQECRSHVYALDAATGNQLWAAKSGCSNALSLTVAGHAVVVSSNFDGDAFDAVTGVLLWNFPTGATISSVPAVAGGYVYIHADDGNLYAVDVTTGVSVWSYPLVGGKSSPAVVGGQVYVGSDDGHVYAVSASGGTFTWSFDTGWPIYSSPAVAYKTVYVGSGNGNLYALSSQDGTQLWKFSTGISNGGVYASPAVANGVVYFGSDNGTFYAVDSSTGRQLWSFTAFSFSSPAVSNGRVFVPSHDEFGSDSALYAFGLPAG